MIRINGINQRYIRFVYIYDLSGSSGPLSIAVADTFSCRTAIVLSGLFYTCGYLGTAFAPSIYVAIITVGIISGMVDRC